MKYNADKLISSLRNRLKGEKWALKNRKGNKIEKIKQVMTLPWSLI